MENGAASLAKNLEMLVGEWSATNRLWLDPQAPAQESETHARISLAVGGQYLVIQYSWAYDGSPQEGVLLMGIENSGSSVSAALVDTFHTGGGMMIFKGKADGSTLSVNGSYAAPEGPDWGWRIEVQSGEVNRWILQMYNITPQGEEMLAVRAEYTRQE